MIHTLDIPWGFRHPDVTYWKNHKVHVYKGALLPAELRRFSSEPFSYHRWQEDEFNGQILPPEPPNHVFKLRDHQLEAAKKIYRSFRKGQRGFLLADKTGLGKALGGSTIIPTPTGNTTMEEVKVGDYIYGVDGRPTKVLEKSRSRDTKFYRITFSDGTTINADSEHRWITSTLKERSREGRDSQPLLRFPEETLEILIPYLKDAQERKIPISVPDMFSITKRNPTKLRMLVKPLSPVLIGLSEGRPEYYHPQEVLEELFNTGNIKRRRRGNEHERESIKNTQEIFETLIAEQPTQQLYNHAVRTCEPVTGERRVLPIDPYTLGVWLGSGSSNSGIIFTMDEDVVEKVQESYEISSAKEQKDSLFKMYTIPGLTSELRRLLNVPEGKITKKIPEVYLNADIEQRLELLRGLLDTDGSVSEGGAGGVSFSQKSSTLFDQVYQLVASFGWTITKRKKIVELTDGTKEEYSELLFYPDRQVFSVDRKKKILEKDLSTQNKRSSRRYITNVEPIEKTEEYYCLSVDAPDHLYLVTESYIPTHNTLSGLSGITAIAKKQGFDYQNKAKLLIVCPKSVIPQWRNTILSYPASTTVLRPLIINYEQLNKLLIPPSTAKVAKKRSTKNRQTASRGTPTVDWDFVIFDESHKAKNYTSQTTKAAERVSKLYQKYSVGKTPFVLFSTATPGDTPLNFSIMAGIIAPLLSRAPAAKEVTPKLWGGFLNSMNFHMRKTKAGWAWITLPGFDKNSPDPAKRAAYKVQLREVKRKQRADAQRIGKALIQPGAPFIMRSPSDIQGWPEQQVIPLPIDLTSGQQSIYEEAWTLFRDWLNLTPARKDPKGALVQMLRYRQKASLLKVPALVDFIMDQVEAGNQVFVSCQFIETVDELKQSLIKKRVSVTEMSGRNVKFREKNRLSFQKNEVDVILSTVVEGISLHANEDLPDGTKASDKPRITIVADLRQNSLDTQQILGRAHRSGESSVAYIPIISKTIEERIVDSFINKQANLKTMTGSSEDEAAELENIFREAAARTPKGSRLS